MQVEKNAILATNLASNMPVSVPSHGIIDDTHKAKEGINEEFSNQINL